MAELLRVEEAAERAKFSKKHMYTLSQRNRGVWAFKVGAGEKAPVRIDWDKFCEWLEKNQTAV